ncbi:MAG: hypothetical protein J6J79_09660 [Lachnospiraceae bacterium]|nr:hypothetical protein [Lachnospiraceae bacterium]
MVDVVYQKKFLRINQIWYPKDVKIAELLKQKRKSDILFVHGTEKEETKGSFCGGNEFHTCINDLAITEEEIWAKINKNVKYEIRRSDKDDIEIKYYTGADIKADHSLLRTFADIYEKMYRSKGMDVKLNMTAIDYYLQADAICFSAILYKGEMIVFHSYICDETDVRLLHSASCFRDESVDRNMMGRVNKRLHWDDIKYFKDKGVIRYDWGGISDFENPNGIDAFKLKFGGEKVTYYNVYAGNSLLGKTAVLAMKLLGKIK